MYLCYPDRLEVTSVSKRWWKTHNSARLLDRIVESGVCSLVAQGESALERNSGLEANRKTKAYNLGGYREQRRSPALISCMLRVVVRCTHPITFFQISQCFGPQLFDRNKDTHSITNLLDAHILQDILVAFEEVISVEIVH